MADATLEYDAFVSYSHALDGALAPALQTGIERSAEPLTGHSNYVSAVAFSPDGRTVATASIDRTLRLWDISNPTKPIAVGQPLTGHTSDVPGLAFSPDAHTLASASADNAIRLWDIDANQATGRVCTTTPDVLTLTRWDQYVSSEQPYRPPCLVASQ